MRITQNQSIHHLLREVNNRREQIDTLQRSLASGRRVEKISDDPYQVQSILRFKKILKLNERFTENINNAIGLMATTSRALNDGAEIIARIKELAVQGSDSLSTGEFQAFENQINELLKELVQVSNTRFNDRFVFGGSHTSATPFSIDTGLTSVSANPAGVNGKLRIESGEGRMDTFNISGQEAFLSGTDVFQTIIEVRDAFAGQDAAAIANSVEKLDVALDQLLQANGKIGAKINRYELLRQQYENDSVRVKQFLSRLEDTDFPQAITNLQMEETALQAALQVLAKTMSISLMDYI